ncbi:hypothetical protein DERP_009915 [Dermatophagoides pteronyssinus]|uniref:MMS22-like C-terminal domain-containing protein n=1 Tax=Dermatophagoides pteronyssinus TaxID=6956 RepID=A0ABQ8J213_DERPT|nr:hypothetical protein DERP_009915 [Dermatophagoides pteronyssinus]
MENYLHCDPQLNIKFCSMFRLMEQCSINRLTLETFAQQLSNTFHYVRSDYFRRLIIQNDREYCCSIKKQKQTWVFFRFVRIPYIDQVNQDRHLLPLFMFIRKNFNLIRSATLEDCNFEFNIFMMIIHDDVHDSNPENSKCFFILKEMRKLLLFIGRLSQFETKFQEFSFHRKSDVDGCFYHHFHLTLQIWLTYLEMLYALKRQSNKFYHRIFSEFNLLLNNDQANDDLFIQCLRLFLYDILCFSLERFQQNIQNDNDYSCYIQPDSTFTPFICTCFQETILLLKFMLNNNNNSNDDQFQSIFFNVLAYFDPKNQDKIIVTDRNEIQIDHFRSISLAKYFVKEFNQYSLWLWSNMVPLLAIDLNLTYKEIRFDLPPNILKIYRTILREIDCQYPSIKSTNLLGKCRLIPSLIICAIRYGCFISDPSIDLVILFMDFFLKRYNYKFSLQSNVNLIDNDMIMTIKDGQKWSEKIQEIIESPEDIYQNNDCFKIFLFYFHQQMKKIQQQQRTNRMKNQQIERITMMNYQKIVSKIVVTLQPNFIRSIQPNGFYRIGQLYLILIESLPTERWLEHNDRLLNPIRELLKEKRTIDFQEILLKFYFAILHLKSATTVEQNHKIVSILNRYMNGILLENIRLIDPKKDFLKIINNYFNELNNLLTKSFQQFFHYYYDDLIGKIELIKMYQQFLSFETDRSDRLIVMEFFKKLLNIFYDKIIVKRQRQQQQQIDEHQSSSPTDNIVNIDNDHLSSSSFDNIIQSLIELLIEMIKLELIASQNDDNEDEPDEIVAYITLKITIINIIIMNNNNNNNRQHQSLNIIDLFLSFQGQDSLHHHHGKCSNSIDLFHLNYLYLLFKDNYLKDIFESIDNHDNLVKKFISIWSKLLIIIDDNDQNDCDTDQRKYEKLLIISRRIYRWFESDSIVLLDNGIIFEKFLSILYDRFGLVTSNSERIKHMNNVDQYFRSMIIKSQQILTTISRRYSAMTKNIHFINLPPKDVRLLTRIYRSIAELISRLSQQIYIVGKSDCLLVTILENIIILPTNCQFLLQIKSLWPSLFRQSFPMIFEGLVQLDPNDPYLNRKIRQLILIYLPMISQYLNYTSIKTLISNRGSKVYENWHLQIILILKSTFLLVQREQTITKDLYEYLNQFCRLDHISHKDLLRLSEQIFRTNITEFKIGQHQQQQTDYRMALFQTIISCLIESFKKSRSNIGDDGKEDQEEVKIFIEQVISPFIKANAQTRPAKLFEVIKFLLPTKANSQCPILFHEFCLEINRQMDYFERISLGANQLILRNLLREFLSHYENKT